MPRTFIALDLETTGLNPDRDAIIEVGAVKFRDGAPVERFATLVDPGKPIPYDSLETTRQTEDEVGVAYLFVLDDAPSEHKFVYKTPGVIIATEFDYEIKGVRLP